MKKILVYGWFGEDNLGDELLLNETLELLSENKDIEAYVMCSNPPRVKKNHNVRVAAVAIDGTLKKYIKAILLSPWTIIKCLYQTDNLIIAGGGAISDWNYSSTKEMFFLINWFKRRNKKVYLLGVGAGPITKERKYGRFYNVLSKADVITVRDEFSKSELNKIGLNNVYKSNDLVTYKTFNGYNIENTTQINKIGLVLVPVCQNTKNVYEDLKRELSNLIKELSTKYEVSIIPFQINYDMEFINELEFDKSLVKILKPKHLWDTLDYMYEQDCIIGMRYHSLVLAIQMKKYFIPIIYHSKSAELCKEYGVEEYASSVGDGENWEKSNINSEDIIKNIGKLEKDINFISHNNSILLAKKMNNKEKEIIKGL